MKKTIIYVLAIGSLIVVLLLSYVAYTTQKVFDTIGINSNKIPFNFETTFKQIIGQKNNGSLTIYSAANDEFLPITAQEYVTKYYESQFDDVIKDIKGLNSTQESQPIIDAGLELFLYIDEIYKHDYIRIAKMIDENRSDEEVYLAVDHLNATKGEHLYELREKTLDLLFPYADKYCIDYTVSESPDFPKRK